ncbi:HD domain-containing protein [candidate division KSB1 bacterium]|nr:HD domain-containing protein [candidate division KSB1 bacterium]
MKIARDICDEQLELIAAAGLVLDMKAISRLVILEVQDVYVDEAGTEDIVPAEMVSDLTRRKTHKLLKRTFDDLLNIADLADLAGQDVMTVLQYDDRYSNAVKLQSFREVIHTTIDDLLKLNVNTFETPLVRNYLNRSYEHALNVSILAIMLGRAFHFSPDELIVLGTASMLHDLGKHVFPALINRPLRDLNPEEHRQLHLHPDAGALIVSKTAQNATLELAAIRQHHEQPDGRGYPGKLTSSNDAPLKARVVWPSEIFRMAEILAVANAYDNLINGDLQVPPMSPAKACECLVRGAGSLYNRAVVSKACELINIYPAGSIIEVTVGDAHFAPGCRGVVRRSAGTNFRKPEVLMIWDPRGARQTPRILDLNRHPGVQISLV